VYDFAQLIHSLGYDEVTIIGHSMGGSVATTYTALYPQKVKKFISIEGIGPSMAMFEAQRKTTYVERVRKWIHDKRQAAGRVPRRYPSIEAAYARMKEVNSFLTDEQARHLTVHGASRNEDGTWSWKFDNYLFAWPPAELPETEYQKLWQAIECPVLLLFGTESFSTDPAEDGRLQWFRNARLEMYENAGHWLHHDQFDRFMADVTAFLAES
jgi:pimeloyl-ACP methyl ester carboxylesterase